MHYRHSYHAGNFADVFKHVVLCGLLSALCRKDKPWCYLETHAGAGIYDLTGEGAERTGEWRDGIARLWNLQDVPEPLAGYLRIVRETQLLASPASPPSSPVLYPGSPYLARALARPRDRLVLCEKVPEVAFSLRRAMKQHAPSGRSGGAKVELHERDGYEAHALLPPAEQRGLVLIDPPFERRDELNAVAELLAQALVRFPGGTYAAWYALKNRFEAGRFERRAARLTKEPPLKLIFDTGAPAEGQMHACGMLIVNPPWQFNVEIEPALKALVRQLAQGPGAQYEITPLS